jgi:hypothetical protein
MIAVSSDHEHYENASGLETGLAISQPGGGNLRSHYMNATKLLHN